MKKLIGVFSVDSGLCWIGDPCYIHNDEGHKDPKEWGKDWPAFLDRLGPAVGTNGVQFNHDLGHPGLGVCIHTAHGDGTYPVYGKFKKNGELKGIEIDFNLDYVFGKNPPLVK